MSIRLGDANGPFGVLSVRGVLKAVILASFDRVEAESGNEVNGLEGCLDGVTDAKSI